MAADARTRQLSIRLRNYCADDPGSWEPVLAQARRIDEAGFDRLVVADHVAFGERLEDHSRPELGGQRGGKLTVGSDSYWLEALTTLSVVAGMTTNVRLGSRVFLAALRRPVVLAKALTTLDLLSGGRLDLGVGVGWQRAEYEAAGLSFEGRGRLLDHSLEVCETLWRQTRASYESPELTFRDVHAMPKPPAGGLPLWVSGTVNPRVVSRLCRFGVGWIPWGPAAADIPSGLGQLKDALAEHGRELSEFQVTTVLPTIHRLDGSLDVDRMMDVVPSLAEAGVTDFEVPYTVTIDQSASVDELRSFVNAFRPLVGRAI